MSRFPWKYTSQEVKEYRDRNNVSIFDAVSALKKEDLLDAIEEFRQSADTDILSDILTHFAETAL